MKQFWLIFFIWASSSRPSSFVHHFERGKIWVPMGNCLFVLLAFSSFIAFYTSTVCGTWDFNGICRDVFQTL